MTAADNRNQKDRAAQGSDPLGRLPFLGGNTGAVSGLREKLPEKGLCSRGQWAFSPEQAAVHRRCVVQGNIHQAPHVAQWREVRQQSNASIALHHGEHRLHPLQIEPGGDLDAGVVLLKPFQKNRHMPIFNIRNTLDTSAFVLRESVQLSDKSFRHIIPSQILILYLDLFLRMKI